MCVVSNIGDSWRGNFPNTYPTITPWVINNPTEVTKVEFVNLQQQNEELKKEVAKLRKDLEELKLLLKAAQRYDEQTGQPNCELEEKIDLIKKICKLVDVDISDVFPDK